MTKTPKPFPKRQYLRFKADALAYALIDRQNVENDFAPDLVALVIEEAMGGCGLIVTADSSLQPKSTCKIKVGELAPLKAEVVWRKNIDKEVARIGCKFLE